MDTSSEYVKMCEKAEEIQDYYQLKYANRDFTPSLHDFLYVETWLPRQDQLQEMVKAKSVFDLMDSFYYLFLCLEENGFNFRDNYKNFSMEQLWLAFVMRERHGKRWTGEDWVKSE